MTLYQFVREVYDCHNIVENKLSDPFDIIERADDLPYDVIGLDESGRMCKLVQLNDTSYIPVLELIAYSKEDIDTCTDKELVEVWNAYMANVSLEDLNTVDIKQAVNRYKEMKRAERENAQYRRKGKREES